MLGVCGVCVFFFKQKTAYEMHISDWSSDVCSSDLRGPAPRYGGRAHPPRSWRAPRNLRPRRLSRALAPPRAPAAPRRGSWRSEERRVGKSVSVRVDLGGRLIIKKKNNKRLSTNHTQLYKTCISILHKFTSPS